MGNDVTWWKKNLPADHRNQNEEEHGSAIPGDTDAPDIVGRTGEEMPEVAHDAAPMDDTSDDRN
jgi:hypothetical protein